MAKKKTTKKSTKGKEKNVLDTVLRSIERKYGEGAVMRMGTTGATQKGESISTGSLLLDTRLGVGGIPCGRITEVFGPEASGKTTLALHIVAEAQKKGKTVLYVDAENALMQSYAERVGVDWDNLLLTQPEHMEQALDITDEMIRSGAVGLVVIDSVAAMVPKAELQGDIGDPKVGLQARLMSQSLRRLSGSISRTGAAVIFINQIRMKIGVMFGNPETTPGGRALKFYSSVRIDIRRIKSILEKEENVGSIVRCRIVKNKVAPPFKKAEFPIRFGIGIWKGAELVQLGVDCGAVDKSGSWFHFGDTALGQGMVNVVRFLDENDDIREKIETMVKIDLGLIEN
ncbi:recombinase RecA [bacterium]|nr:recombinase RecA [bacterium]